MNQKIPTVYSFVQHCSLNIIYNEGLDACEKSKYRQICKLTHTIQGLEKNNLGVTILFVGRWKGIFLIWFLFLCLLIRVSKQKCHSTYFFKKITKLQSPIITVTTGRIYTAILFITFSTR